MKKKITPIYFTILSSYLKQVYFDVTYVPDEVLTAAELPHDADGVTCSASLKDPKVLPSQDVVLRINNFENRLPSVISSFDLKFFNTQGKPLTFDHAGEVKHLAIEAGIIQDTGFDTKYQGVWRRSGEFWDELHQGDKLYEHIRREVITHFSKK